MSVALVHRPSVARSLTIRSMVTTRTTVTTGTRTGSVGPSMKPLTRLALDSCGSPGLWIETSPTSPPSASPTSTASLRIQRDVAPAQLRASAKRRKRDDLSPGAAAAAVSENSLVFAPTSRTSGLRIPAGDPGPGKPHSILMRRSFAGVQPDRGHLVPDHMAVRLHSEPDRVGSGAIPSGRRVDDTAERQVPVQTVRHREPRPAADPPDASGDRSGRYRTLDGLRKQADDGNAIGSPAHGGAVEVHQSASPSAIGLHDGPFGVRRRLSGGDPGPAHGRGHRPRPNRSWC